jgi:chemotaxis protein methyltransferase WspC
MSVAASVIRLLSDRLGFSPELLGSTTVERALDLALGKVGTEERAERTARLLETEGEEWQMLIEELIVPETWFFRDKEPFHLLASHVAKEWLPVHPTGTFHALCVPCASGEEPYSVAMTLLDAGVDAGRIRIDAADVSERGLARARLAIYGRSSFRERSDRFRMEYFIERPEGRQVRDEVARLVCFEKANLLDLSVFRERAPYDVIFCRNGLIYFDNRARWEVMRALRNLLNETGLLFTGHAELPHFLEAGYVQADLPHSFACRKGGAIGERLPARVRAAATTPAPVRPARDLDGSATMKPNEPPKAVTVPEQLPGLEQAEYLADRGELEAAAAICKRLLAEGVHDPGVYALLGVIGESAGDAASAEEFFRKALYLDPYHYESLMHMSLILERDGDVEGSRLYRGRAGRALSRQEREQALKSL